MTEISRAIVKQRNKGTVGYLQKFFIETLFLFLKPFPIPGHVVLGRAGRDKR